MNRKYPIIVPIIIRSWVREAIDSFLNQKTNFDFELLSLMMLRQIHIRVELFKSIKISFPGKEVRTFRNEVNLSITRTWKKVCQEAKGQYIARCDSDDFGRTH